MPTRPTLNPATINPQQAGWSATFTAAIQAITTWLTGQPIAPPQYTVAAGAGQLPAAGTFMQCLAMVTDGTAGKGPLVYSDGTNWRYVSDDSIAL